MIVPRCAWCGKDAGWWVVIEPARVTRRGGRVQVIAAERRAPACDECRRGMRRLSPARRRAKAAAWARLLARRQPPLF